MRQQLFPGMVIAMIASIALMPIGAVADSGAVRDPDDSQGRLDVKTLRHGHTSGGDLKHVIVTRESWTKRHFAREGFVWFYFSSFGDSCAEIWVAVDVHRGDLRARWQGYDPLGCPKGDDSGGFSDSQGELKVRKPGGDRLVLILPRDFFPKRVDSYRWAVTTIWHPCDPCGDSAPDRGNADRTVIRHEL